MSYGSWWVEFTAKDFEGKASDVVFDMESSDDIGDCFWFEIDEDANTINIVQASDEVWGISDEALEDCLHRLWSVHKSTISGYCLMDLDDGIRRRIEWNNDTGVMVLSDGIDPADYTVEQLQKIQEFAKSLKEDEDAENDCSKEV